MCRMKSKAAIFFMPLVLIFVFAAASVVSYASEESLTEASVEKITVEDMKLYYMGDGHYGDFSQGEGNGFYYDSLPEEMTVYFKDGTSLSGTAESFYELTGHRVNVTDNQESLPWTVGKYKCSAEFMGVSTYYYVEVLQTPVKALAVEDVVLYEGIDGVYYNGGFYYDAKPLKTSVYFKDTTAATGTVEEIKEQTGYQVYYDTLKKWDIGKQSASAYFLGVRADFIADVRSNPIYDVRLTKAPSKTEYYAGETFDIRGAEVRVCYNNGKTEDAEIRVDFEKQLSYVYLQEIDRTVLIESFIPVKENDYQLSFDFFSTFFNVEITVKDAIEELELTKNKDGFPCIRFLTSRGEEVVTEISSAAKGDFNTIGTTQEYPVVFITEKGLFAGLLSRAADGYKFLLHATEVPLGEACDDINWAEASITQKAKIIYNNYEQLNTYNGMIGSDNIDKLLSYAACMDTYANPKEIHKDYYVYTATEIQKCVRSFFAVDGVDITLSGYYDAKTNTVRVKRLEKVNQESGSSETGVAYPVTNTFNNGVFNVTLKLNDGKTMSVTADEKGRIASYNAPDRVIHKHMMYTIPQVAPTYLKSGLTAGVGCSLCKQVLTPQKEIAKLVLGAPEKIEDIQSSSAIKLSWLPVKGASGYEIFVKTPSGSWKSQATTTKTSAVFSKLPSGKKYTLAVRAYVTESGKVVKAKPYITTETATRPLKPSKAASNQNDSAIRLLWSQSSGATGYRLYYRDAGSWKSLGETSKTQVTFTGLKSGAKFTFAIRPYVIVAGKVLWSESYTTYTAATVPSMPEIKAVAPSTGRISLSFGPVNGGEVYQVFYKTGDGDYKLYKNYSKSGTLHFGSLKSRTTYTFAVRAAKNTSAGWLFGPHNTAIVTVK